MPLSFVAPPPSGSNGHGSAQPNINPPSRTANVAFQVPRIPRLRLDVDVITDMVAAKLATSLLGHVLFLKNQVPFPVAQLMRLPDGGKPNSRAIKLRHDLLDSFDTLSSHLDTTFTALSTAFARCSSLNPSSTDSATQKARNGIDAEPEREQFRTSQAYMAILVGPSIGTAKSRVFFAVDRLETKIWGTRDDIPRTRPASADESEESDAEEEERDSESEISEFDSENEGADDNGPDDSDSESTSDQAEEDSYTSTPSSPTSRPPTPPRPKHLSPNSHSTSIPHPVSEALEEHVLEQQRIRAASHQLSRVLATADAEGRGMQCELAPTQTHILLRAPRRFTHPAWMPRSNMTRSMEQALSEFVEESGLFVDEDIDTNTNDKPKSKHTQKRKQKQKTEGVWVTGRTLSPAFSHWLAPALEERTDKENEEDEMIWWSWDGGKIVGFSAW